MEISFWMGFDSLMKWSLMPFTFVSPQIIRNLEINAQTRNQKELDDMNSVKRETRLIQLITLSNFTVYIDFPPFFLQFYHSRLLVLAFRVRNLPHFDSFDVFSPANCTIHLGNWVKTQILSLVNISIFNFYDFFSAVSRIMAKLHFLFIQLLRLHVFFFFFSVSGSKVCLAYNNTYVSINLTNN